MVYTQKKKNQKPAKAHARFSGLVLKQLLEKGVKI